MSAEPMSGTEFIEMLMARVPSTRAVVDEHLTDQDGELLLHLLMADVSGSLFPPSSTAMRPQPTRS
jgi:hypothetical protein